MALASNEICSEKYAASTTVKFQLLTCLVVTAGVAQDLIRDTGDLAGVYGYVGPTYLAEYMPANVLPRGKKAAAQWVEGFGMLFEVISEIFDAGMVPTPDELEQMLALAKNKKRQKLLRYYAINGASNEDVLEALVMGAKYDWEEGEFKDTYCEDEEQWDELPTCATHDFDWDTALDVLAA
jgi:hypothetical protein